MMRARLGLLGLLLLGGCISIEKVETGRTVVKDALEVQVPQEWNRYPKMYGNGPGETWTRDGIALDTLTFYVAIKDGEALYVSNKPDRKPPLFKSSMGPTEVVELVENMMVGNGGKFDMTSLEPVNWAEGKGFRFGFKAMFAQSELERQGLGYGIVRDGKLYMILYQAPRTHYYTKHLKQVQSLVMSAKLLK